MSSQKQSKRIRAAEREMQNGMKRTVARLMWLERRPPWWKFWAFRRWRNEEPTC